MIHICKTTDGKEFYVVNISRGKVLKISENLKTRVNCIKNIMAEAKLYNAKPEPFLVQDDTFKEARRLFWCTDQFTIVLNPRKFDKKYIPKSKRAKK